MGRYDVRVTGADRDAMTRLIGYAGLEVLPTTLREGRRGLTVRALADDDAVAALEREGYGVERLGDTAETAHESFAQVGRGNRFLDRKGE